MPVRPQQGRSGGFPLVGFAATVQFAPTEHSGYPRVESRMLLAGEAGRGDVVVNGTSVPVGPETILVMPWGHRVRYHPDSRDPFLVYGAHLIPWHAGGSAVELTVPHHPDHRLAGSAARSDRELAIGSGLWITDDSRHPVLKSLIKSAAQLWDRGNPTLETAQALGVLIMNELQTAAAPLPQDDHQLPARLRRMLAWVNAEPGRPVTLDQLAAVADASTATVTRLFRLYLDKSPLAWVLEVRIGVAKTLLTTTTLPVNQIARRAGFSDAYYFSRQFRARTGLTPSAWRRSRSAP